MRRAAKAAAWLVLISLTALLPFLAAVAPVSREEQVRRSYQSWTGVLRLWKCEGADMVSGTLSLNGWLNGCIEAFERRHPGVYVQVTDVTGEELAAFTAADNPPDILLHAPGVLEAPYSLLEMEEAYPVRSTLAGLGVWKGARYAVPVALGGYAMAVNTRLLDNVQERWSEIPPPEEGDILSAPADGAGASWSAALLSMFAGSWADGSSPAGTPIGEGIDLGLPAGRETQAPRMENAVVENALPNGLPDSFRTEKDVYAQFTKGEIAAMPVTQREVRRLQTLSESGKGPDWQAEAMGLAFTDQAALFSVVAWPRVDIHERQALALELLSVCLSEKRQQKLNSVRAFPVTAAALYSDRSGMAAIEAALASDGLVVPPAFGNGWRAYADQLMDGVRAGEGTRTAYERLTEALREE